MSVKVTDNTSLVLSQTEQRANVFLRLVADKIIDESTANTPKKAGNLRRDILKIVSGLKGKVEWRKKYASYQERGMRADGSRRVRNYSTPGTGPHFAENAVKKVVRDTKNIAKLAHLT